ncbi:hypothetical protein DFH06DRAFT_1370699 [Mycena polygramma]|nr:hypothetical protein DFH06DRAFT_1370699 [Mycena polygramma]
MAMDVSRSERALFIIPVCKHVCDRCDLVFHSAFTATSGSGATYYDEELKYLLKLLKNLPQTIPVGDSHNFIGYVPDAAKVHETGCVKTVVSHKLEISLWGTQGAGPTGARIIVAFKSRGPGLEEVVPLLRTYITGKAGVNVILAGWVDDLQQGALAAIEAAGDRVPRPTATTAAKRYEGIEVVAKKRAKQDGKAEKEMRAKETEQGAGNWDVAELTDDEEPEPNVATRGRGAPKSELLDRLTVPCHAKSTGKARFRCSGAGCQWSWASPRQSERVLSHAVDCRFLSADPREEALETSAEKSLGAKVDAASSASPSGAPAADPFAAFRQTGTLDKAQAREAHTNKSNLYLLNLLCDAALPPKLVDNKRFKAFVDHLHPGNGLFVSTSFSTTYIPNEVARVTTLAYAKLRTCNNLTISYDGGTPYFLKGDVASGVSHTGEHLKEVLMKVIKKIGPLRFGGITSDSTGNTKVARELVHAAIATILIMPDPCHHLANLIRDLCSLDYFVDGILKMRDTISFFSKSSYSATHLASLRVSMDINKGLEKIGKIRFGTLYWAGYALAGCLPAIHQLVTTGVLSWMKNLRIYSDFQIHLKQLVCVLEPIARAIKCLEGLQVTVGDVWKFYVAITAVLHDLFLDNSLGFPGPSGDLYLSGFYLDPEHVRSPILRLASSNQLNPDPSVTSAPVLPSQARITDQDLRDSMPTYTKVGRFLLKLLATELEAGRTALQFESYQCGDEILAAFRVQFESFTRQYPPFSARNPSWTKPYLYWTAMLEQADAGVLASSGYFRTPSSMPEERTVSRFTRQNSNDRANQVASGIVGMTKIYQHNRRDDRASEPLPSKPATLNWRSVKTLMDGREKKPAPVASGATEVEVPDAQVTDDAEAGLAALNDTDGACISPPRAVHFATQNNGVDITIPFFRDLLSDTPLTGADQVRSLSSWTEKSGNASAGMSRPAGATKFSGEISELVF